MNTLKDVQIDEISLVDAPANAGSTLLIYKRDDSTMAANASATPEIISKSDDDALQEQLVALSKSLADLSAENQRLTDENAAMAATIAKRDDDALQEQLVALSKSLADLSAENQRLTDENAAMAATIAKRDVPQPVEDIIKGLPEPVAKAFEEVKKRAIDAEARVKQLTDQAEEAAYIAKAAQYEALPVSSDVLGKLLLRIRKGMSTSADADEVERLLAAASIGMDKVVAGPVGKSTDKASGGTALDRMNSAAAALQAAQPDLTPAQAITKALAADPALYDDYLAEKGE